MARESLPAYTWALLGDLSDGYVSWAIGVNNEDQIVGWGVTIADEAGLIHPFLWQDGVMHDLGTLGGDRDFPTDINERGQIVGTSYLTRSYDPHHAFLWDGAMRDLGTLSGASSEALRINDRGQVIGHSDGVSFLWEDGVMHALPLVAADINNRGQIAGWVTDASAKRRAAVWEAGTLSADREGLLRLLERTA